MTTVIHEHLAPLTFRIGFLNSSFVEVADAFVEWKRQHFQSIASTELQLPFERALLKLQPLTAVPRRWLIVETNGGWVAYFDNGRQGPDPVSAVSYIARLLGCRGVVATSVPHTLDQETGGSIGLYGAVQFELFAAHPTNFLNYERSIGVVYDGGKWNFDVQGRVQDFEDTVSYRKRRVVERFSSEMLIAYCHALGIGVDDPRFYQPRSVLVSTTDPMKEEQVLLSIQQAQKRIGMCAASN